MNAAAAEARAAEFENLKPEGGPQTNRDVNMDVILDVPVTLSMEVGRTRIPIRNLLQLNQGSVIELDRAAGEPLDVFVNGTLVAHGEVVVVNEKFGIRLTDVISPAGAAFLGKPGPIRAPAPAIPSGHGTSLPWGLVLLVPVALARADAGRVFAAPADFAPAQGAHSSVVGKPLGEVDVCAGGGPRRSVCWRRG